jgi:pimeloyl-ACP methyl ester carboxylesterase
MGDRLRSYWRTCAIAVGTIATAHCLPAQAQPYSPPPSDFTSYWTEPAFKDSPYKGPSAARGILFWSHGVSGKYQQWQFPPPEVIHDFARAGWDVVKVQRNNLHENGWAASGVNHVADLVQRIKKAHDEGYRFIIAAGQSYGGAISLEASARTDLLFGVIAFAPGHGSDACGRSAGQGWGRIADNLQSYLVDAIIAAKAPRVVVSMADGDECQGHNDPTKLLRDALNRAPGNFIFLDTAMPVRGHGAAATAQFQRWYGSCLRAFLDPDTRPSTKETACPAPSEPHYMLPSGYVLPKAPVEGLVGAWSGQLTSNPPTDPRHLCLAIESDGTVLKTLAMWDAGPERKTSMTTSAREFRKEETGFVYRGAQSYRMVLMPRRQEHVLDLDITSPDGRYSFHAEMKPGC